MHNRTFFRILTDNIFINNPFCKAISAFVNFCNDYNGYRNKDLKFLNKLPLYKNEPEIRYKNRFIFDSYNAHGVHSK